MKPIYKTITSVMLAAAALAGGIIGISASTSVKAFLKPGKAQLEALHEGNWIKTFRSKPGHKTMVIPPPPLKMRVLKVKNSNQL